MCAQCPTSVLRNSVMKMMRADWEDAAPGRVRSYLTAPQRDIGRHYWRSAAILSIAKGVEKPSLPHWRSDSAFKTAWLCVHGLWLWQRERQHDGCRRSRWCMASISAALLPTAGVPCSAPHVAARRWDSMEMPSVKSRWSRSIYRSSRLIIS